MERANLQLDYNNKVSQLNACQAESRTIEEQLEFVRDKKTELGRLKDDVMQNKQRAQRVDMSINFTEWRGHNYGSFYDSYMYELCYDKYRTYFNEVDHNIDALVDEERRLENRFFENEGLIGRLRQGLNWLTSEIEKLTN